MTERLDHEASASRTFAGDLRRWSPALREQDRLRHEYIRFIDERGRLAAQRDGGPEHLTASCFVFSPDLTNVLLCFHKKGGFWVQLGGHIEPDDASVAAAAFRETREESGLLSFAPIDSLPFDLNRHSLASAFGRCATHWDVGFAAFAPADAVPVVSEESDDVAWWPVDRMPDQVPEHFGERMNTVLTELANRPGF